MLRKILSFISDQHVCLLTGKFHHTPFTVAFAVTFAVAFAVTFAVAFAVTVALTVAVAFAVIASPPCRRKSHDGDCTMFV
ncbi:hypothetical protein POVWA1_051060 [Plasmodium ovale wallikeri]|uniref:Uncharacterized protein n=1 Tax=Plasmodium ovale wallikeri TaxID=864142 RepID=A0A1A8ZMB1_PLAOA|nr:hypothetical protein POVWA1_051060 [Plasmodium ovale wallikeri]